MNNNENDNDGDKMTIMMMTIFSLSKNSEMLQITRMVFK